MLKKPLSILAALAVAMSFFATIVRDARPRPWMP